MFCVYPASRRVLDLCVYSVAAMIVIQSSMPPPSNGPNNPWPILPFLVSKQQENNKKED